MSIATPDDEHMRERSTGGTDPAPRPLRVRIIVPCYNEEGVIPGTVKALLAEIEGMVAAGLAAPDSGVVCVDDGSRDNTWAEIDRMARADERVRGIKLSANFGHANALVAGLFTQRHEADVLVTIDADLQDDVSVIPRMIRHHQQGKRVVYGVRLDRGAEAWPKRLLAALYYRLMGMMNDRTVAGHADFRSADAGVVADLERFGEVNLYLRGLFPLIGYPSAEEHFTRLERHAGSSKYTYRKLLSLAWQGITSFTTTPLRLVFYIGLVMFAVSMAIGAWVLWAVITGDPVKGWASLSLLVITFSAINMVSLGVIGEYIGKIYKEVKHRPRYIIERTTHGG